MDIKVKRMNNGRYIISYPNLGVHDGVQLPESFTLFVSYAN